MDEKQPGRPALTAGARPVFRGDALDAYSRWPAPDAIISDGAYGVGGFPGDPRTADNLAGWYEPHIEAWAEHAGPSCALWFWNTELGWATVHPVIARHGWDHIQTVVWDKGVGHIAGNVNGDTIRRFPVVTEVCSFYRRRLEFPAPGGPIPAKQWLRREWKRTGLPLSEANHACGVASAATRKYLTQDWMWYPPPPETMERLAVYANEHGQPDGSPYFSVNGDRPVTAAEWSGITGPWNHTHGITNVWSAPPLRGRERYKGNNIRSAPRVHRPGRNAAAHLNQKPLEFMRRIVSACTNPGGVVWEPFGGLCSAVVAAAELGREGYAAETVEHFADLADERISQTPRR